MTIEKPTIKILPHDEAIKIAAGEVIERPANIVKELIENALDAKASHITITVIKAGKESIQITDNGIGMSQEDIQLSVAQHATSKITTVHDLESTTTFGFRGEALASINSVSNITIISKTAKNQTAHKMIWNFGKLLTSEAIAHQTGTTIIVEKLFENIPARQKFLKKDETEWRALVALFQAYSLAYPHIHFQLYNDTTLHYNCPPVKTTHLRSTQLWNPSMHQAMLPLNASQHDYCKVTGTISKPTYHRYDRNQIFIFVNKRWIKNIDTTKAIMRGYAGTLPPQKFPAAAIFIEIDYDQVDINIHPKKEEVRFIHPRKVETAITQAIKTTLQAVTTGFIEKTPLQQPFPVKIQTPVQTTHAYTPQPISTSFANTKSYDSLPLPTSIPQTTQAFFQAPQQPLQTHNKKATQQLVETTEEYFNILGQYKKTYILLEKNENLVLIDQHAAHERILYEQFKKNFTQVATIQLMFPHMIKIQPEEALVIKKHLHIFQDHGIAIDLFSDHEIMVQQTPVHLKNQNIDELIQQIIMWITQSEDLDHERIQKQLHEKIHAKMACSAAVKAGESLSFEQMKNLLQNLKKIPHNFSCPHGRPTHFVLPIDEIEKKFKRDYGKKAEQLYDFI